ncbi:MAG: biotin--[acetyl-CoA-carboxylase] ligase [Pseudomonadota bacterium]
MAILDAGAVRDLLSREARDRLDQLETFADIDSTNSYLMQLPGPPPGRMSIAATTNQTAGRGQRGRAWVSPPGSGVCLSLAYTYDKQPQNLSALTLAMGVSAINALEALDIKGVQLKWPNDLVANDGKLGGILTEAQQQSTGAVTVVTGIGVNVRLPEAIPTDAGSSWARQIVDLASLHELLPTYDAIAASLISHMLGAFLDFEGVGFALYTERWRPYDWLIGREVVVDVTGERVEGIASGVAENGELLVATEQTGTRLITSGSVVLAGRA